MARPRHLPDAFHRRQVEALAGYGVPEAEIAGLIGIDPKTLRKYYRPELDFGHIKANAKVAENLFRKATGEGREAVTAAIFWLKARARWKETSLTEHSGIDGGPITGIRRIIVAPPDRAGGTAAGDRRQGASRNAVAGQTDDANSLFVVTGVPRGEEGDGPDSGRYPQ